MTAPIQLIDSHCHVHFGRDPEALKQRLELAKALGVAQMLCISIDETDRDEVIQLARDQPAVLAAAAIHPTHDPGKIQSVDELLDYCSDDALIAVGETGLDYFHIKGDVDWQKQRFINHIEAAIELGKPLVIHTRESMDDTLDILESRQAHQCRGIMHCFTGNLEQARRALDFGFKISFTGIITYNSAKELQEVVRQLPLDCMLVETDSPYLAPVPYRGKANQPAYVVHVAEKLAQIKKVSFQDVARATTASFYELFPQTAL